MILPNLNRNPNRLQLPSHNRNPHRNHHQSNRNSSFTPECLQ
uniref:Uncharacterized protein n=1 Tax=Luteoviridae sp. TaxID=1955165 RepID=A0A9N7AAP3_9LUTE|nr:MAG TPA: hypothetical protein [Luteoviridae sp.]